MAASLLVAGATAGCSGSGGVGALAGAEPVEADAEGIVVADSWPDACELAAGDGTGAQQVTPEAGSLPDGTPLPGARACTWTQDGTELGLRVTVVTTDVEEAWLGYQYTLPLRRPVSEIGDEAFLSPIPGAGEELWVCRGLTIFTVTAPGLPEEEARIAMFAAASKAVLSLEGTAAGSAPPEV